MTTSKSLSRLQGDNISHWTTTATAFLTLLYICQLLSNLMVLYLLSDSQILTLYHEDDSVPNEAATTLIGEVKGQFDGLLLVPSNVVIKTKCTALGLDDNDLCNTEPYILYMASVTTNTSTVNWKKRKRTETHDEASSTLRSARQRTFEQPQRLPAFIEEFHRPGTSLLAANSTILCCVRAVTAKLKRLVLQLLHLTASTNSTIRHSCLETLYIYTLTSHDYSLSRCIDQWSPSPISKPRVCCCRTH